MKTLTITKGEMINEILGAVNAKAERNNGKRADGDMFFSLAFRTEKELIAICKKAGITLW